MTTVSIPLTQGKFALIDEEDLPLVEGVKWCTHRGARDCWYAKSSFSEPPLYMHRLIAGAKKGQLVDHINGDGLDNRRANLRIVTRSQNNTNKQKKSGTKSRFKGVLLFHKTCPRPWAARIGNQHLGSFATEEEAARVYDDAARELYGEFARTNEDLGLYD